MRLKVGNLFRHIKRFLYPRGFRTLSKHPIYPGVMIIEGMAQAGGVLAFKSLKIDDKDAQNKVVYFMSIDKAKFRLPVVPGDRLIYKLSVLRNRGHIWQLKGKAFVDEKLVAEAELKAMIVDK